MTQTTGENSTLDEVSLRIDATPEMVWDLISDMTRMGQWSPECFRCVWLGRSRGPGARFIGFNRRGPVVWATANKVEEAERGKVFSFRTTTNGTVWRYLLEPADKGTIVTEQRDTSGKRAWISDPFAAVLLGGRASHAEELRSGMRQTLERIKTAAEQG